MARSGWFDQPVCFPSGKMYLQGGFSKCLRWKSKGEPLKLISAGTIPLSNIAIGLKVGASLFLVILMLSVFRIDNSTEKKE